MPTSASNALPPLPDLFGNPLLRGELTEVVAPGAIDWLPQTLGWKITGALLALWLLRRLWQRGRAWLRNRYRREALHRLAALGTSVDVIAINEILKLAAMTASSRRQVAALSGEAWCRWLQTRTDKRIFSDGSLAALGQSLYDPETTVTPDQIERLINEARHWLQQHRDDHGSA